MSMSAIASSYGQNASKYYQQLSSGKKINSASDNAAGLAIAEKQKATITQARVNAQNMKSYQDRANVADAAMSGMTEYAQDNSALSIRAMNGTMSSSDLGAIANQMSQNSAGASGLAATKFNEGNAVSSEAADSLNQSFDLSSIDSALASINSARSTNGAESNGYAYSSAVSENSAANLSSALSSLTDTDMAEASSALKREQTIDSFKVRMQKDMMEQEAQKQNINMFV
ncbi:MAG: hypothetical protein K6B41_01335 [Butyrivibrio sp.]|nr:hypothetical protein [Butyrivibrio sp.]